VPAPRVSLATKHVGLIANQRRAVCADVVLIGAKLPTFGRDPLQFLLGWRVSVANVHQQTLIPNAHAVKLLNNGVANVARFKASKSDAATIAHAIAKYLAREDFISQEDAAQLLCHNQLLEPSNGVQRIAGKTHHLTDVLRQVGDVKVRGLFIAFGLQAGVERFLPPLSDMDRGILGKRQVPPHPSKANFVSQPVKTTNAQLRMANIIKLGKAKTAKTTPSDQISIAISHASRAPSLTPCRHPS